MKKYKWLVPTLYIIFLMLPIYWLINMSFKTTTEIINTYSLWPQKFTTENYVKIFTDSTWYMGYEAKSLLAWSPPEDWMNRLTPPYNESTNHV